MEKRRDSSIGTGYGDAVRNEVDVVVGQPRAKAPQIDCLSRLSPDRPTSEVKISCSCNTSPARNTTAIQASLALCKLATKLIPSPSAHSHHLSTQPPTTKLDQPQPLPLPATAPRLIPHSTTFHTLSGKGLYNGSWEGHFLDIQRYWIAWRLSLRCSSDIVRHRSDSARVPSYS